MSDEVKVGVAGKIQGICTAINHLLDMANGGDYLPKRLDPKNSFGEGGVLVSDFGDAVKEAVGVQGVARRILGGNSSVDITGDVRALDPSFSSKVTLGETEGVCGLMLNATKKDFFKDGFPSKGQREDFNDGVRRVYGGEDWNVWYHARVSGLNDGDRFFGERLFVGRDLVRSPELFGPFVDGMHRASEEAVRRGISQKTGGGDLDKIGEIAQALQRATSEIREAIGRGKKRE